MNEMKGDGEGGRETEGKWEGGYKEWKEKKNELPRLNNIKQ